jgi:uncharacterized protein YjgD (DUF1641 family)
MDAPTDERRMIEAEVQQVAAAARAALTDEMVSRLATTAGEAIDLMDQVNRAGLARAIPAIAEMVNNGDLSRLARLARVYASAEDALTDEMVGRMTDTVGQGLSLLDQVNRAGLERAIPAIAELVNNGDLNRISRLARVYASAEDALTDEMIGRMTDTVGQGLSLLDRFSRGGAEHVVSMLEGMQESGALERIATLLPQLVDRLTTVQDVLQSIDAAAAASREAPPTGGGLGGLWHMMRDPETQDTLRFLLSIGKQMRKDWGAGKK